MHFKVLSARMVIANYDSMEEKDLKQIICEMCGSNKLIKKNGIYECQYCGCQYTLEEARKLIVEGTVKVDESDKIVNWLKLADSAFNNSSWREAYSYYCKILEVYPEEWRSIYRKALSIGWQSSVGNIRANETLGGIVDGYKMLMASDNADEFKAWGIVLIEQDLLHWINAVQSASENHAHEYTDRLESACHEYYQRSSLMASVVNFAISLFTKFVVINIEDTDLTEEVYDGIQDIITTILFALGERFRVYLGKKYSTFWQAYFDDYSNIDPPEYAKKAQSDLRIASTNLRNNYNQWKKDRQTKLIHDRWERYPEEKQVFESLQSADKLLDKRISEEESKLNSNKGDLAIVCSKIEETEKQITLNINRIHALENRWYAKQRALEEADKLKNENSELQESLRVLNSKKEELKAVIHETQNDLNDQKQKSSEMKGKIRSLVNRAFID